MSFETQFRDLLNMLCGVGDGSCASIKVFGDGAAVVEDDDGSELTMVEDIFDYKEMERALEEIEKCL